jgi:ABC-type enterochelin transport system permease subunit
MSYIQSLKTWIGGLTEVALMLLALGIAAALLVGGQVPFVGNVVGNIIGMVSELGKNGIVGLIALGVILWLFSHRSVS